MRYGVNDVVGCKLRPGLNVIEIGKYLEGIILCERKLREHEEALSRKKKKRDPVAPWATPWVIREGFEYFYRWEYDADSARLGVHRDVILDFVFDAPSLRQVRWQLLELDVLPVPWTQIIRELDEIDPEFRQKKADVTGRG